MCIHILTLGVTWAGSHLATPLPLGVRLEAICTYHCMHICVYLLYHQSTIPYKAYSSGLPPNGIPCIAWILILVFEKEVFFCNFMLHYNMEPLGTFSGTIIYFSYSAASSNALIVGNDTCLINLQPIMYFSICFCPSTVLQGIKDFWYVTFNSNDCSTITYILM